jgi:hypothetical protein
LTTLLKVKEADIEARIEIHTRLQGDLSTLFSRTSFKWLRSVRKWPETESIAREIGLTKND